MSEEYERQLWYDRAGEPISLDEWVELQRGDKVVAQETVGHVFVSTVWLGIDMRLMPQQRRPIIFETMTFDVETGEVIGGPWRYSTEEDARAGHRWTVRELKGENGWET